MERHCHSCGIPLSVPGVQGPAEHYCAMCADEAGNLKSREEVRRGIAQWLQSRQPNLDEDEAFRRAGHYLKAMPAWAE